MTAIKGISFDFLKCEFGFGFEIFLCFETYQLKHKHFRCYHTGENIIKTV